MDKTRQQEVERLYNSALECRPEDRATYLAEVCPDPSLRREVESLLQHGSAAKDFLETQALEAAVAGLAYELLVDGEASAALAGRTLSHYQILEKLGAGGMGIVYKAFDTRLKRPVALKVLPPDRVSDPERKRRFVREARAASALNHPNIVTIYDIDQVEGIDFIAMECVAGQTLDQRIPDRGMQIAKALEFGIQIADGLAAAHSAGIIHRDLKPSNVMVSGSGQVKILDFGLARVFRERQQVEQSVTSSTTELDHPGLVMGTAPYMSPEAAEGKPTDRKTDVWSWGCLLFECLTGQRAFQGKTVGETLAHVLTSEPNWAGLPKDLPKEVREFLQTCLEKDPSKRLQDMAEARRQLGKALDQLEHRTGLGKLRRLSARFGYAVAAGLVLIVASVWFVMNRYADPLPLQIEPVQLTRTDFWEAHPALSPNGQQLAYSSNESGNTDIYVRDWRGGDPFQVTRDTGSDDDPEWFADGNGLFFSSDRDGSLSIWKADLQGRDCSQVVRNARYPAVSPDGRLLAMSRPDPSGFLRIAVSPIEQPSRAKFLTGEGEGTGNHFNPTWSPDGRQICYADSQDLWIVSTQGGDARRVTQGASVQFVPAWAPDGRHIYFPAYRGNVLAIWRVRPDGTSLRRVTFGTGIIGDPCVSRDGKRMFCGARIPNETLIVQDVATAGEHVLNDCTLDMFASLSFDLSRVIFACSHRYSAGSLWFRDLVDRVPAGSARNISGVEGHISHPALSKDGKWVAYYNTAGENLDIYVVAAGGGKPIRITDNPARERFPAWSPDGSLLAFCSDREGNSQVWLAPMREGRPSGPEKRLTGLGISALFPWFSLDGKQVAFVQKTGEETDVCVVPVDGSRAPRRLTNGERVRRVRWLGSESILASGLWGEKRVSLRVISAQDGSSRPFGREADFGSTADACGVFDVSSDGTLIVYCRDEAEGDLWLLESNQGAF